MKKQQKLQPHGQLHQQEVLNSILSAGPDETLYGILHKMTPSIRASANCGTTVSDHMFAAFCLPV
jgi:hypothetical protein